MGLVLIETENREELFLMPELVESIAASYGGPTSTVSMRSGAKWLVRGSPSEVHAALFPAPPPPVDNAYSEHALEEALDPATYAQEWENHSPNCARAMAWAMGLVRARLGVGE